jgi:protein-tyrosine phosphatase
MIDLHCHILPDLDDGPATLEESVEMCRMAADDGIRTIVATPHFRPGRYQASSAEVFTRIAALETAVHREKISVRFLPGAEVTVIPELAVRIDEEPYLTLNATGRYFLAELPSDSVLPRWDAFLLSLTNAGRIPILAHPERNPWFWNHPEALYGFVGKGGMVQITAASLTGLWGDQAREFSALLLQHNLVHCLASDAHDAGQRRPALSEAVRTAAGLIGRDNALSLVTSIPEAIIENRRVSLPEPMPILPARKRKTWT